MLYDTHCHPYLAEKKSQEKILNNFLETWDFLNCVWIDIESSKKSILLAKKKEFIFATIWIHPSHSKDYIDQYEKTIIELEQLYLEDKNNIVAIWECWLDYHYLWEKSWNESIILNSEDDKKNQKIFFKAQIELAKKYNLPIIIHNRDSKDDIFEILLETNFKNFVFHCYSENLEYAYKLINFSPECKISFSWILTFKNAKDIQETAKNIPLKNIIIETDSPYLTPTPLRWKEENEPSFTKYILDKIIELRNEDSDTIKKTIFTNSLKIFKIKK
jgi:TatD DNase family protein